MLCLSWAIGLVMEIYNWEKLKTGDDAYDATFFNIKDYPKLAFECHQNLFNNYLNSLEVL